MDTYSFFMHDQSENNQGYEHMLDFQMSWVMRVAANKDIQQNNPILYKRCFDILMKLIEKEDCENVEVRHVYVWKQWKRIDVIAHVEILCDGKEEKHVVVLEDKAYTLIHDDQLRRYEETVAEYYKENDFLKGNENNKHYWVITFFGYDENGEHEYNYQVLDKMCNDYYPKWKVRSFEDILDDRTPTGSEHFDDFWIYKW